MGQRDIEPSVRFDDTSTRRCPYCAEEILAEAIRCKHCKSDLLFNSPADFAGRAPTNNAADRVVTIERTKKSLKAAQAFGWLMFFFSLYMLFAGDRSTKSMGGLIFWISIIWLIVNRIARWWQNE